MIAILKYAAPYICIILVAVGLYFGGRAQQSNIDSAKYAALQVNAAKAETVYILKGVQAHEKIKQKVRSLSSSELHKRLDACCLRPDSADSNQPVPAGKNNGH